VHSHLPHTLQNPTRGRQNQDVQDLQQSLQPEEQAKTTAPAALAAGAVAACCAWGQGSIAPARARPGPTTQFEQWEIAQRFLSQPGYALQEKRPSPSTQPAQC